MTIEEQVQRQKEVQKKARKMELLEELEEEGVDPFAKETPAPSGFEKSTVSTTKAMHAPDKPELSELHSVIPKNVLSSVYELHFIHKASLKEQAMMVRDNTIDKVQKDMNQVYVEIMEEGNKHIDRELAALEGSRAKDAVENIRSLVTGENIQRSGMIAPNNPGFLTRVKKWFAGQ